MSSLMVDQLVAGMLHAAKDVLAHRWPEVGYYVTKEFRKIGEAIDFIEVQREFDLMSDERARLYLEMQKNAAKAVLSGLEDLSPIVVEVTVSAALNAVKTAVNNALGFVLI